MLRSRTDPSRRLPIDLLIAVAGPFALCCGALAAASAAGAISNLGARGVVELAMVPVIALAAHQAVAASPRAMRGFWRLIAVALGCVMLSYVTGAVWDWTQAEVAGVASAVTLLLAYPFLLGALAARAIREEGFESGMAAFLDVAILVGCLAVVGVRLVLQPLMEESSAALLASGISWAGNLGLLAGALWIFYRLPAERSPRSIALLCGSMLGFTVLSLVQVSLLRSSGGDVPPWGLTAAFALPYLLVAAAPSQDVGRIAEPGSRPRRWSVLRTALPYLAFIPLTGMWMAALVLHWDVRVLGSAVLGVALLIVARQVLLLRDHNSLLVARAEQALTDGLTGVRNRRAFDEDAALMLETARRHTSQLALVLIDLNGLKLINDLGGHPAGDDALRVVSEALALSVRATDRVYRIGGDEFALLLADCDRGGAARVLDAAAGHLRGSGLTVAAGTAVHPTDAQTVTELVEAADRRLYRAKRGRPAPSNISMGPAARGIAAAG